MMIRREALCDIGDLDERYFMYVEEMDWCRRARARGWSIGYAPAGSIVHLKGEITRHHTFSMLWHFHRSMSLYCLKYRGGWNPWTWILLAGVGARFAVLLSRNLLRRGRRVSG
jgi:GT2 family glycosyltransferase